MIDKDDPFYTVVHARIEALTTELLELGVGRGDDLAVDSLQAISSCLSYYAFQCLLAISGGDVAGALFIQAQGLQTIADHMSTPEGTVLQ